MKYFILFILLFQFSLCHSQFNVGDTREVVIDNLIRNNVEFTENRLTDSTSRISVLKEGKYQMIWILNTDNVVFRQTLISEKENGVNEIVRWFNEDFVTISDIEWRNYEDGKIFVIKLEHLYGEPLFSITLSPDSER